MDISSKVGKICCQDANGNGMVASLWLLFCVVNGIMALNASIILSFSWAVGNCGCLFIKSVLGLAFDWLWYQQRLYWFWTSQLMWDTMALYFVPSPQKHLHRKI